MSQNILLPFLFAFLERRTDREMVWMSLEKCSGYLTFGEALHGLLGLLAGGVCDGCCCLAGGKEDQAEVPPQQGTTVWRTQVEQEQAGRPLCSTVVRQPAHGGVWGEVVIAGHRGQMLSIQVLRDWAAIAELTVSSHSHQHCCRHTSCKFLAVGPGDAA